MAWDDSKSTGSTLTAAEWNSHTTDQKGHKTRHQNGGTDEMDLDGLNVGAGLVVGTTNSQSLTNKTLDNTNTVTLKDTLFTLQDDGDTTKQTKFQLSGITTATTRTLTVPDADTTIVGHDAIQTLSNKTLTNPLISQIYGGATANDDITIEGTSHGTKTSSYIILQPTGGYVGLATSTPRALLDISTGFLVGTGLELPHVVKKTASANIRNSHDAEATTTSGTYVKLKTITLTNGLVGQQRFLFDLKTGTPPTAAYGRIYRNGVALGTEQTDITGGYVTKSEDITQTWNPGDTAELWVHGDGALTAYVQNFRIAYDDSPTVTVASVNS